MNRLYGLGDPMTKCLLNALLPVYLLCNLTSQRVQLHTRAGLIPGRVSIPDTGADWLPQQVCTSFGLAVRQTTGVQRWRRDPSESVFHPQLGRLNPNRADCLAVIGRRLPPPPSRRPERPTMKGCEVRLKIIEV